MALSASGSITSVAINLLPSCLQCIGAQGSGPPAANHRELPPPRCLRYACGFRRARCLRPAAITPSAPNTPLAAALRPEFRQSCGHTRCPAQPTCRCAGPPAGLSTCAPARPNRTERPPQGHQPPSPAGPASESVLGPALHGNRQERLRGPTDTTAPQACQRAADWQAECGSRPRRTLRSSQGAFHRLWRAQLPQPCPAARSARPHSPQSGVNMPSGGSRTVPLCRLAQSYARIVAA